jgi:cytochrome c oxidase subunit II
VSNVEAFRLQNKQAFRAVEVREMTLKAFSHSDLGFSRSGRRFLSSAALTLAGVALLAAPMPAFAGDGQPHPWQFNFQQSVTPIADRIHSFHNVLMVLITLIVIFVLGLLIWIMIRFNSKANPTPSRTSHNTLLEVAWTIVPVLILLVIAIPSFRVLYAQYDFPKADVTIKATGHQWYWSYNYPDQGGFGFDSLMIEEADLKPGQPRLLAVDNEIVVPVNKVTHVLMTADDVIHNWTVPAFGVKMDAVPGRVARVWFQPRETGVYYGQCSELCGERHAFMPIQVRVVSEEEFTAWVAGAKKKFASDDRSGPTLKAAAADGAKTETTTRLAAAERQ